MFSFKAAVTLAVLAMLVVAAHCSISGSSSGKSPIADLSGPDLWKLYSAKVYKAERMERPFITKFIPHAGVRVTLNSPLFGEDHWLVHMGKGYGSSFDTVVVRASWMLSDWTVTETKYFEGSQTVSDLVKAGGTDYTWYKNNCYKAAARMMALD